MKKILLITGLILGLHSFGQNFTPVQFNGLNKDVIAEDIGTIVSKTSSSVSYSTFNYFSNNWQLNANTNTINGGLPNDRIIQSTITQNLFFQLADYSQNNCLQVDAAEYEYEIELASPINASKIFLLVNTDDYIYLYPVVHFTDGTTQEIDTFYLEPQDNNRSSNICYTNFSFINRETNNLIDDDAPSFSQLEIEILPENQNKLIDRIEMEQWAWMGVVNYFAMTIQEPSNCIAPNIINTTPGSDNVDISISTNTSSYNSFYYEVRTSGNPGSNDQGLITSGTTNTTTTNIGGLLPGTQYTIYLKQICNSSEESDFGTPQRFVTSCIPIDYLNENFNSYDIFSQINVPYCWSIINTNNNELYNSFNTFGYDDTFSYILENFEATPNDQFILVSPQTNNLGNGNYRIKFKASSNDQSQLNIVTLSTNTENATITHVTTINLEEEFREYTVNLPATTDSYFGFQHPLLENYTEIKIDDVIYEPIPSCPDIIDIFATTDYQNSTVEFSWNSLGDHFEIQYGPRNFTIGTGSTIENISSSPYTLTLQNHGLYDYYIRRICDNNDTTQWFGPYRFNLDYCIPGFRYSDQSLINITINNDSYTANDEITQNISAPFTLYNNDVNELTINNRNNDYINAWIDINNDGVYEGNEEILINNISGYTVDLNLDAIPLNEGTYNARIISTYFSIDNSCPTGWYGNTFNFKVNIVIKCATHSNIMFDNINQNGLDILLNDNFSSNTLEYGISGFTRGTGTTLNSIYSNHTVNNLLPNTTYDFYIKMNCNTSDWAGPFTTTTLCDTPAPTGEQNQILANDSTISDILVNGENIKFYNSLPLTNALPEDSLIRDGIYYITQTLACESIEYLTVNVTTVNRIDKPRVSNPVRACENIRLSDIPLIVENSNNIKWYNSSNSTTTIPSNTVVNTNSTYYVTQYNDYTESHKQEVVIQISNEIPNQLTTTNILVCRNIAFRDLTLNENYEGELKWYLNENDFNPINPNTLVNTGLYYVTQKVDICESPKQPIQIENNRNNNPVTTNIVDICGSGIINDLQIQTVNGAELKWYTTLTSSTPLSNNTNLTTSTYYVEQVINGCASERKAVVVRVNSKVAPIVNDMNVCENTKFEDLVFPAQSGTEYVFYISPSSTVEINKSTLITTGNYYVARKTNNCISDKKLVRINVTPNPSSPTGESLQIFVGSPTVNDLDMHQTNVTWYSTYQDAILGNNPLMLNMPLTNGYKYYAVLSNGNCRSLPTEVTVSITLSNDMFEIEQLKIYPNPFFDIVNIEFSNKIDNVEIFTLDGKSIHKQIIDDNNQQLNLSHLHSGTYILNIYIENNIKSVKLIKN